jgi:3-oxoacyl-[acyl-carrier protein] reductase
MIAITPRSVPFAIQIADALAALDIQVEVLEGSAEDLTETQDQFESVGEAISSVLHVCGPTAGVGEQGLATTDEQHWIASCEAVMRSCLFTLQAAFRSFNGNTGSIVVITPTLGISGAAGVVPFATAVEGVRALCKSAARQWGKSDVTVNLIGVPLAMFSAELGALTSHQSPAALGRLPETTTDVASAIQLFLSPTARGITGSTIVVDGGSVMAP